MEASPKSPRSGPLGGLSANRLLSCQPDAVLCRMAARGNAAAYEVLYLRHHRAVHAFVFHMLGGGDRVRDAEDIAQDVFARAFAAIGRKRDGSFRHWIFTIARNRVIDQIRARPPRVVPLHDAAVEQDPATSVDCASSEAEERAEFAWMVEAVGGLPERQREALVLRELGGMSHAEIAAQLDTTEQATKQLIKRARASVGDAARDVGIRPHNLRRELTLAAPIVPIAATIGLGAAGAGAAGFGSSALVGKAAAVALCVAAIGGTTAAVERSLAPSGERLDFGPVETSVAVPPAGVEAPPAAPRTRPDDSADRGAAERARDGRRRSRERAGRGAGERHDGSVATPSTAPAASGSAAAGDEPAGKVGGASPGFGPAARRDGADRSDDAGSGDGGTAAPK